MPNIKLSYEKTSKTKIRALLLFLVLNGLLLLGCTSRDTEASKPEFLYKKRFESALFYVENVWKIKIKSADCSKGQEDCKYRFIVEDVLKGDKNHAKKEYSLNQNLGLIGETRFGQIIRDDLFVYWPRTGDNAFLFVEKVSPNGEINPFFTRFSYSMDRPLVYVTNYIYLTPFQAEENQITKILKNQTLPFYVPPLSFAKTIGEQEEEEKSVYDTPDVWQVKILSKNISREIKVSHVEAYVPKRYNFKIRIEKVLKGNALEFIGKEFDVTALERCYPSLCKRIFGEYDEQSPPVTIGIRGMNDSALRKGKIDFSDNADNGLRSPHECYVWIAYNELFISRLLYATSKKEYLPLKKTEFYVPEKIKIKH